MFNALTQDSETKGSRGKQQTNSGSFGSTVYFTIIDAQDKMMQHTPIKHSAFWTPGEGVALTHDCGNEAATLSPSEKITTKQVQENLFAMETR